MSDRRLDSRPHGARLQAEYARIPYTRNSIYKIPDALADEQVLFLTDILATGYEVYRAVWMRVTG